jgi:hypothetical protein
MRIYILLSSDLELTSRNICFKACGAVSKKQNYTWAINWFVTITSHCYDLVSYTRRSKTYRAVIDHIIVGTIRGYWNCELIFWSFLKYKLISKSERKLINYRHITATHIGSNTLYHKDGCPHSTIHIFIMIELEFQQKIADTQNCLKSVTYQRPENWCVYSAQQFRFHLVKGTRVQTMELLIMQFSPATSSLLGPNIFLSSLFSNTLNLCSSLNLI